jgi:uncharacterized protein
VDAVIDVEVPQEILHRYRAIRRWDAGRRVYDLVRRIMPKVIPVTADDTDHARRLMDDHPDLSARDALHAAICLAHGLEGICSYDRDFDVIDGIVRSEP